ncbi:MAG: rRNA maturation RNase YbeY [Candidatus Pacebacteria bacterium]|nr:rRNA maturation RNase YbeY [Candidatus Paceibacterota bacterium]
MVNIFIKNISNQVFFKKFLIKKIILKSLPFISEYVAIRDKDIDISVILQNEKQGRDFNIQYRKKDYIPGTLSMPNIASFKNLENNLHYLDLGVIFLIPKKLKKISKKEKVSLKNIYIKYISHSLLHLFNYSHDTIENETRMNLVEEKILKNLQ